MYRLERMGIVDTAQDHIPLAAVQEHFWSAADLDPSDGALTECVAYRLRGTLQDATLRQALTRLLARHEILRSTVVSDRDGPAMCIDDSVPVPSLTWLDLADRSPADRLAATHEELSAFAEAGCDLASGPLVRFLVAVLDDEDCVFALAVHHIVADATAVRIMLSELSQDYLATQRGEPSPIADPEIQYGDFAEWERASLLPAIEQTEVPFWRGVLSDAPPPLDLRLDRPRPTVKGTRGRRAEFRLANVDAVALRSFARAQRTTPYAAGMAAFAALAGRSTGAEDFFLGVLAANRTMPELHDSVGQFSNTLPLRIAVDPGAGFAATTAACARSITDALDHCSLPLSRMLALGRADRDPARTPLFEHLFLPKLEVLAAERFCGSPATPLEVRRRRGRFDTIVELEVSSRGVSTWVEYDTALYDEAGIAALMADYDRVLAAWLDDPSRACASLPLAPRPTARATVESAGGLDALLAEAAGASDGALIVNEPVTYKDLEALGGESSQRMIRVLDAAGGRLAVDLTDLPRCWPRVLGSDARRLEIAGEGDRSPFTPGELELDGCPTGLTARWSPSGELELVACDDLVLAEPTGSPADVGNDAALLGVVLDLWREELERPDLDLEDDFFAIGGYSITAARLVAEVSDRLGVTVGIRTLFENPTPAMFVAELRRQHPHLDELLSLVASAPETEFEPAAPVALDAEDASAQPATLPLLAGQRQLWLAEQANPGSLTHTIPLLLRIDGPVDTASLRAAVADVVERQAGLRGIFVEAGGEPQQRIVPFEGFEVPLIDLLGLPEPERAERATELERETAYGGFDITTGPLLRARLVRTDASRHVLHLLFHHLVTDEVSMTVFMRELSAFYAGRTEHRAPDLQALSVGFADLVLAEQALLEGPQGERLREFWQRALAGAEPLTLPSDRPRPGQPDFAGEFLRKRDEGELVTAVAELARAHRTTMFAVFAAGVFALLQRLSGQSDLTVGMPTDNRSARGAERLIGCFLNVVPLRVDCSGDPAFGDLLDRVTDRVVRSYEHQGLPFAEIVEAVRPRREANTHPIYQVTCELQTAAWMPVELAGCRVEYELLSHGTARYDMSFHSHVHPDALEVWLEINTDLWDRESGLLLIDRVLALLAQATADPGRRVSQLKV